MHLPMSHTLTTSDFAITSFFCSMFDFRSDLSGSRPEKFVSAKCEKFVLNSQLFELVSVLKWTITLAEKSELDSGIEI